MRLYLIICLICTSCAKFLPTSDKDHPTKDADFSLFHYNIKELNSKKIRDENDPQLRAVKKIIPHLDFDIFSFNEIQYDLPGVPTVANTSQGENLTFLAKRLGLTPANWSQIFAPANTGTRAKRNNLGEYYVEDSIEARKHADPFNYGLFPAQYSTAGLTRLKVLEKNIIHQLKWRSFNPKIKLAAFKTEDAKPLPEDIALFDKNFNHLKVQINDKIVHLIFLHTVPSYHFGNKFSPNYVRNADQLKFLEWYTTGKTDFLVNLDRSQWPTIQQDDAVVIVGDLNADINQKDNPGGTVLRRLIETYSLWMKNPGPTNESSHFGPKPFSLLLDYILVSPNLEVISGGVIRPDAAAIELGCDESKVVAVRQNLRAGRSLVSYRDQTSKKPCYRTVSEEYFTAKTASDHFPIFAYFKFKE